MLTSYEAQMATKPLTSGAPQLPIASLHHAHLHTLPLWGLLSESLRTCHSLAASCMM